MDDILVHRRDAVVTIELNRPEKLNAVTRPMWPRLEKIFDEITRRQTDRVMILTGAGPAFCSGVDLGSSEEAERHPVSVMRDVAKTALALHSMPKPTIARVDGPAVGAGLGLALACDLVVASERARFSAIHSKRAMSVDFGGSWLLPRLVGIQRAKQLVYLGEMLDGDEAFRLGLANSVVAPEELDRTVSEWAQRLATGPQLALALSKQLLNQSFQVTMEEALEGEAHAQAINQLSGDIVEAKKAFYEKRPAAFGTMDDAFRQR